MERPTREVHILYKCDPEKNVDCAKRLYFTKGGACCSTPKKKYAVLDSHKKPLIDAFIEPNGMVWQVTNY